MMNSLAEIFTKAAEGAIRERGHANVLIAGRSGVGKSTLINSVFQGEYAAVGHGRPITDQTRAITREGIPLTIYDTRGLELENFDVTKDALLRFVKERRKEQDVNSHIHVAWICVAEDLRRIEEAESNLLRALSEYVPSVAVITKARSDNGFRSEVARLLPEATNVLRVRAIEETLDDGHTLPTMGLTELVNHTLELFPEGQRRAFVAAQKVDLELKKTRSQKIVLGFAATAAGMGATPIPMADTAGVASVYVAMFAGITATYGLNLSSGSIAAIVATVVGAPVAILTAPMLVGSFLKFIPGAGTLAGGVITGGVAAALATSLGFAYIEVLHRLFVENLGEAPDQETVIRSVEQRFKKPISE